MNYREPTPPEQDLVLRSTVVKVKDNAERVGSGKPSVQVDISLFEVGPPTKRADESRGLPDADPMLLRRSEMISPVSSRDESR